MVAFDMRVGRKKLDLDYSQFNNNLVAAFTTNGVGHSEPLWSITAQSKVKEKGIL